MSSMDVSLIILCLVLYRFSNVCGYDYCSIEKKVCKNQQHIACHPQQMLKKGKETSEELKSKFWILPMTTAIQNVILNMHNAARNDMACGTASDRDGLRFPAAAYMRELKWDRELEFTATKMVQSCIVEHDECRATSKFDNVGQNIAVHYAFLGENFTSLVQALVREWYDEYQDASVEDVEIVKGTPGISHFLQVVADRVTHVGCAFARCEQKKMQQAKYLYACNYSFSKVFGHKVYTNSSNPAQKCDFVKSKKSSHYNCLCAPSDFSW